MLELKKLARLHSVQKVIGLSHFLKSHQIIEEQFFSFLLEGFLGHVRELFFILFNITSMKRYNCF